MTGPCSFVTTGSMPIGEYHERVVAAFERLRSRGEHEREGEGATGPARWKRLRERRRGGLGIESEPGIGSTNAVTVPAGGPDE